MLVWWIVLIFHISVGFAQKNCSTIRAYIPAPDFDDEDNLSARECGIWDKEKMDHAPWSAAIRPPEGSSCWGTLVAASSILTFDCNDLANEFAKSGNKSAWNSDLGKCSLNNGSNPVWCKQRRQGQITKIRNVTKLNAPGYSYPLHLWKIDNAALKRNYIAPVCFSNKGNQLDYFGREQQYKAFKLSWYRYPQYSARLLEDFGHCQNKSENFRNCSKVHPNFLCTRVPEQRRFAYLTYEEEDRTFLRALQLEDHLSREKFCYEIVPLLDQILPEGGGTPLIKGNTEKQQKFSLATLFTQMLNFNISNYFKISRYMNMSTCLNCN